MVATALALAAALALATPMRANAQYSLSKAYAGSDFFDAWDFYGAAPFSLPDRCQFRCTELTTVEVLQVTGTTSRMCVLRRPAEGGRIPRDAAKQRAGRAD